MPSRRQFLKFSSGFPFYLVLPKTGNAGTSNTKKPILLDNFFIAGFQFYEGKSCLTRLIKHDLLLLKNEPGNKYDPYAVAIFSGRTKLGYIPKVRNQSISSMLLAGMPLFATVENIQQDASPWEKVSVSVYLYGGNNG